MFNFTPIATGSGELPFALPARGITPPKLAAATVPVPDSVFTRRPSTHRAPAINPPAPALDGAAGILLPVSEFPTVEKLASIAADAIEAVIRERQAANCFATLALDSESCCVPIYRELIRRHREEDLSFANVVVFSTGDYCGLPLRPDGQHHIRSRAHFLNANFLRYVDISAEQVHFLDHCVDPSSVAAARDGVRLSHQYDDEIDISGGINLSLLAVGPRGALAFNFPGAGDAESQTRLVALSTAFRRSLIVDFHGEAGVPRYAATIGLRLLLQAGRPLLIATGDSMTETVRLVAEERPDKMVPASLYQMHAHARLYVDQSAAEGLSRNSVPWLVSPSSSWTPQLVKKAVFWLSRQTGKPILRLDASDFEDHSLHSLLTASGSDVDYIAEAVYTQMSSQIFFGRGPVMSKQRVLFFSPHPDDDVISAGGMLGYLANPVLENDVHVAYCTNGSVAVSDRDALRQLMFAELAPTFANTFKSAFSDGSQAQPDSDATATATAAAAAAAAMPSSIPPAHLAPLPVIASPPDDSPMVDALRQLQSYIVSKPRGALDMHVLQQVKAHIRVTEATSALSVLGVPRDHAKFLDLPFYRTGTVEKMPHGEADVAAVLALLKERRPQHVFVAGDLADPHGTHRVCYNIISEALQRYNADLLAQAPEQLPVCSCPACERHRLSKAADARGAPPGVPPSVDRCFGAMAPDRLLHTDPVGRPLVWLYRGAWKEWDLEIADVILPLSKGALSRKIDAIFCHESQKDRALFPGTDDREFWMRSRDRNIDTAQQLNALGFPQFFAAETFCTTYTMP
jgi:glucosamine-6-phosphate deaminase